MRHISWTAKPWLRRPSLRKSRNILALTLSLTLSLTVLGLFPVFQYLYHSYVNLKTWLTYDPLWSYAYVNASSTTFPPHDPTYTMFETPTYAAQAAYVDQPLQKIRRLMSHCRDAYFAAGVPCHASPDPPLDVVWTWANGSDRLFQEALTHAVRTNPRLPFNPTIPSPSRPNTHFFRYV